MNLDGFARHCLLQVDEDRELCGSLGVARIISFENHVFERITFSRALCSREDHYLTRIQFSEDLFSRESFFNKDHFPTRNLFSQGSCASRILFLPRNLFLQGHSLTRIKASSGLVLPYELHGLTSFFFFFYFLKTLFEPATCFKAREQFSFEL